MNQKSFGNPRKRPESVFPFSQPSTTKTPLFAVVFRPFAPHSATPPAGLEPATHGLEGNPRRPRRVCRPRKSPVIAGDSRISAAARPPPMVARMFGKCSDQPTRTSRAIPLHSLEADQRPEQPERPGEHRRRPRRTASGRLCAARSARFPTVAPASCNGPDRFADGTSRAWQRRDRAEHHGGRAGGRRGDRSGGLAAGRSGSARGRADPSSSATRRRWRLPTEERDDHPNDRIRPPCVRASAS